MKLNYGQTIFLSIVLFILIFSTASTELIPEPSSKQPIKRNSSFLETVVVSPPLLPVHHTVPILSTDKIVQKKKTEPTIINSVLVNTTEKIDSSPSFSSRASMPLPSSSDKPIVAETSSSSPVPFNVAPSTEKTLSVPLSSSVKPVTLPAVEQPSSISIPSSPDIAGTFPATSNQPIASHPVPPLASDRGEPLPPVSDHTPELAVTSTDRLPTSSEQPTSPLPLPSSSERSVPLETSTPSNGSFSEHFFHNHELTIEEILNESSKDEGPIILRPKEVAHVEPAYVPAPLPRTNSIACPHCGRKQIWQRGEPCTHCSFCGHTIPSQNDKTGRITGDEAKKSVDSSIKNFRSENPLAPNEQKVLYVPIKADVNLNRRELLRRRLNHQRVSQYMKSISPDTFSGEVQEQHVNNPMARGVEQQPLTTSDSKPPAVDAVDTSPEEESSSFWSSWFFGSGKGWGSSTKPKSSKKLIRSEPSQQTETEQRTRINCPFAKQHEQH